MYNNTRPFVISLETVCKDNIIRPFTLELIREIKKIPFNRIVFWSNTFKSDSDAIVDKISKLSGLGFFLKFSKLDCDYSSKTKNMERVKERIPTTLRVVTLTSNPENIINSNDDEIWDVPSWDGSKNDSELCKIIKRLNNSIN